MPKLLALLLVILLVGCAVSGGYELQQQDLAVKAKESLLLEVPIVLQDDASASALAVLESLSLYLRKPVFQKDLRRSFPVASVTQGYSISEIVGIARRSGFDVLSLKSDTRFVIEQITQYRPVIVQLVIDDNWHYLLVCGYHPQGLWVMDPAKGIGFIDNVEFQRIWSESGSKLVLLGS